MEHLLAATFLYGNYIFRELLVLILAKSLVIGISQNLRK